MSLIVLHQSYGCDTGCCGHVVQTEKGEQVGGFHFVHCYDGDTRAFIENLVRDEGCDPADIDWDNCIVGDD